MRCFFFGHGSGKVDVEGRTRCRRAAPSRRRAGRRRAGRGVRAASSASTRSRQMPVVGQRALDAQEVSVGVGARGLDAGTAPCRCRSRPRAERSGRSAARASNGRPGQSSSSGDPGNRPGERRCATLISQARDCHAHDRLRQRGESRHWSRKVPPSSRRPSISA